MSTCTNGRQNSCCLKCNNVSLQLSKYLTRWTKWDQMDWPKLTSQPHVSSVTQESSTQILHDDLHWLDVADRVTYKLGVIMHRCQHGKAPQYLVDCCTPVTDAVGRQCLRSATQQLMVVPRHRLYCWTPSIRCARPHGLKLLAGRPPRTAGPWVL